MAHMILHHNGVYNIWSTVVDAPIFESGLTLDQLRSHIKEEYGNRGLQELEERLERAWLHGTSSRIDGSLDDHIDIFIRLHKGGDYDRDNFIYEFLTVRESK